MKYLYKKLYYLLSLISRGATALNLDDYPIFSKPRTYFFMKAYRHAQKQELEKQEEALVRKLVKLL